MAIDVNRIRIYSNSILILAKVRVASSSLVSRSIRFLSSFGTRATFWLRLDHCRTSSYHGLRMSHPRSPHEKKRLSLERDSRPAYGENHKRSRKNVLRNKLESLRRLRRRVNNDLPHRIADVEDIDADGVDLKARATYRELFLKRFKKYPAISLRDTLRIKGKRD